MHELRRRSGPRARLPRTVRGLTGAFLAGSWSAIPRSRGRSIDQGRLRPGTPRTTWTGGATPAEQHASPAVKTSNPCLPPRDAQGAVGGIRAWGENPGRRASSPVTVLPLHGDRAPGRKKFASDCSTRIGGTHRPPPGPTPTDRDRAPITEPVATRVRPADGDQGVARGARAPRSERQAHRRGSQALAADATIRSPALRSTGCLSAATQKPREANLHLPTSLLRNAQK